MDRRSLFGVGWLLFVVAFLFFCHFCCTSLFVVVCLWCVDCCCVLIVGVCLNVVVC